jgi:hypothetical protein
VRPLVSTLPHLTSRHGSDSRADALVRAEDKPVLVFVSSATKVALALMHRTPLANSLAPRAVSGDPGKARRVSARLARFVERYLLNPQMRLGLTLGLAPRAFAYSKRSAAAAASHAGRRSGTG